MHRTLTPNPIPTSLNTSISTTHHFPRRLQADERPSTTAPTTRPNLDDQLHPTRPGGLRAPTTRHGPITQARPCAPCANRNYRFSIIEKPRSQLHHETTPSEYSTAIQRNPTESIGTHTAIESTIVPLGRRPRSTEATPRLSRPPTLLVYCVRKLQRSHYCHRYNQRNHYGHRLHQRTASPHTESGIAISLDRSQSQISYDGTDPDHHVVGDALHLCCGEAA